jgi:hypothetical protein
MSEHRLLPTANFQLPKRVVRTSLVRIGAIEKVAANFTLEARAARVQSWEFAHGNWELGV